MTRGRVVDELKSAGVVTVGEKLKEMTFDEQMEWAYKNVNCITTEDILKQFVIESVENDDFNIALHILKAIKDNPYTTEYYRYDYSMGTLETPIPITSIDDIEDLIDLDEEI